MTIFLGIDDTDSLESIGTGRLARKIADEINGTFPVIAVTRHQFLVHPDIPYTSHNSGAAIWIDDGIPDNLLNDLFDRVSRIMKENFVEGSDPGIALARDAQISPAITSFALDAKRLVLTQEQARTLAAQAGILLQGLGGTEGGVIGALAAIGLASTGNDGRFLQLGNIRSMAGDQEVKDLLAAGISQVITTDGKIITEGRVRVRKFPQPACILGKPVILVEEKNGEYILVKRD